jgi:hypothetical protein
MRKLFLITSAAAAAAALAACQPDADPTSGEEQATAQTQQLQSEAQAEIGMPRITHFTERKLAVKIAELRDKPNLLTYTYLQDRDGRLHCLSKTIGYGLPYSTQITNPSRTERHSGEYEGGNVVLPQAEPNTLFPPASSDATWVLLVGADGQPEPLYVEPKITVALHNLTGPIVAERCAA